jgi:hypothetical protein
MKLKTSHSFTFHLDSCWFLDSASWSMLFETIFKTTESTTTTETRETITSSITETEIFHVMTKVSYMNRRTLKGNYRGSRRGYNERAAYPKSACWLPRGFAAFRVYLMFLVNIIFFSLSAWSWNLPKEDAAADAPVGGTVGRNVS